MKLACELYPVSINIFNFVKMCKTWFAIYSFIETLLVSPCRIGVGPILRTRICTVVFKQVKFSLVTHKIINYYDPKN